MNTRLATSVLAALAGVAVLAIPGTGSAANVGHYSIDSFGGCTGSPVAAITAAGHTPVALATLDAASLAPLQGLVIVACGGYPGSSAVSSAVANGLRLLLDTDATVAPANLPGAPALDYSGTRACDTNYAVAPGSDVSSGPGGSLTDDSLDVGAAGGASGYCSVMGTANVASLPSGAHAYVFPTSVPQQIGAFSYPAGNGTVVLSMSQWQRALPGGAIDPDYLSAGAHTYFTNAIAWMMQGAPTTTCASEGYTGTKLTWCQNICEKGYTGSTLDTWIRRWINRYHDLPYCAIENEQPPA